jgi:hypothetical protein
MTEQSYIESALSVTVTDGTTVAIADGLGAVALVAADVALGGGGEITRLYSGSGALAQAAVDLAASEITQAAYNGIAAALAQGAVSVYIILWDLTSGGDDVDDALNDAEAAGVRAPWDFVFVGTTARTAAVHVTLATWAASRRVIPIVQSADGDWLTSSVPSGYSSVTGTNMFVIYEDTNATEAPMAAMGRYAGLNPRVARPSSNIEILGGILSAYTVPLTSAQIGHLGANRCNYHAPRTMDETRRAIKGSTSSAGNAAVKALNGRSLALRYTQIFTEVELIRALGAAVAAQLARGVSTGADAIGEAWIRATINPVFALLLRARYITPNVALGLPDGYSVAISFSSGAESTASITGNLSYLGEVVAFNVALSLVTE